MCLLCLFRSIQESSVRTFDSNSLEMRVAVAFLKIEASRHICVFKICGIFRQSKITCYKNISELGVLKIFNLIIISTTFIAVLKYHKLYMIFNILKILCYP